MIKISILVPVYNVEKYLEHCLISIFEQTYPNIQYVFVNDCSTDNSEEILRSVIKRYPQRENDIIILSNKTNKGLATSRKTALENMTGDYFINVDSDDYIDKELASLIAQRASENRPDIIVYDCYELRNGNKREQNSGYHPIKKEYLKRLILSKATPSFCLKAFNTNFFRSSNLKPIEGIDNGEDFSTVIPLVYMADTIGYINQPLYYYNRENQNSYTQAMNTNTIDQLIRATRNVESFLNEHASKESEGLIYGMKVRMMNYLYRNVKTDYYPYINSLYPELKKHRTSLDFLPERMLSFMAGKKMYNASLIYIKATRKIKDLFSR